MSRLNSIIIFIFLVNGLAGQTIPQSRKFKKYQKKCEFEFELPIGFREIDIVKLPDLKYDLNLINDSLDIGIRYSIFYNNKKSDFIYFKYYVANFWKLMQEDTTAQIYNLSYYDSLLVRKTNSDAAGHITFDIKSPYGEGYIYCTMIYIHKHNLANIYITVLFNDFSELERNQIIEDRVYNSIRFRNKSQETSNCNYIMQYNNL